MPLISTAASGEVQLQLVILEAGLDKPQIAAQVAKRLLAAEMAIDVALAEASRLMETLAHASAEVGGAASQEYRVPALVSQAMTNLAGARSDIVGAHAALETLGQRLSLPASAFGVPIKPRRATAD